MANKPLIRTVDLLAYFKERYEAALIKFEDFTAQRELARIKYNENFWNRLFKFDFETSNAGNLSWLHTRWDSLIWAEDAMAECERAIAKCEYHDKCGNISIPWDFGSLRETPFYAWCKANNIPH